MRQTKRQYFTLPHLFRRSPQDSGKSTRLHRTPPDSGTKTIYFCWSSLFLLESAGIHWTPADSSRLQHPATAMPATAWLPPVRVWVRVRVQVRVQVRVRVQIRGLGRYIYILVGRDGSFLTESRLSCRSPRTESGLSPADSGGLWKKNWPMCHMTIF